jgi:hypothetical protein
MLTLTLLLALLPAAVAEGPAAPPPQAAPAAAEPIAVETLHGTDDEHLTAAELRRLLARFDTSRWTFTREVRVDRTVIPHSHPVLTLHARHLGEPELLLSTYLHEQIHWWLEENPEATDAARAELRERYPEVPVGYPEGARDERSTYVHLIVCWLEIEAMRDVAGAEWAQRALDELVGDHYTWIYGRVRDDGEAIGEIVRRHGLVPAGGE